MKHDNETVRVVVRQIIDSKGKCDPRRLWKTAEDPSSPLHDDPRWLGWDRNRLADAQLDQIARNMIRFVRDEESPEPRPQFVTAVNMVIEDDDDDDSDPGYIETETALATQRDVLLDDELRRVHGHLVRFESLFASGSGVAERCTKILRKAAE